MITVVVRLRYGLRSFLMLLGGTFRGLALVAVVMAVAMGQCLARLRKRGKAGEKKSKDAKAHGATHERKLVDGAHGGQLGRA